MEHNMIDMHNKTVVVTGANSGVGFVTAKRLAEAGAEIVMVCRPLLLQVKGQRRRRCRKGD